MIGDPATRYREDPVRILRAIRIAAKLGFTIDEKTAAPMHYMQTLLLSVPSARLADEFSKMDFKRICCCLHGAHEPL